MELLNSVIFEGRIMSRSDLIKLASDKKVLKFRIYNGDTMIDCEAWESIAENIAARIKRNVNVRVVGRLKQGMWGNNNLHEVGLVVEYLDTCPERK